MSFFTSSIARFPSSSLSNIGNMMSSSVWEVTCFDTMVVELSGACVGANLKGDTLIDLCISTL